MIGTSRGSWAVRVFTSMAAASLVSVLLTPDPGAASSVETCHGVTATIVGSPGQSMLSGTDGPDVIVSNGVRWVGANAGDDLICVTGRSPFMDAGDGDDVVDATMREGRGWTELGNGADQFMGGPGFDRVFAGDFDDHAADHYDRDADVVDTGAGGASVSSGLADAPNADQVHFGAAGSGVNTLAYEGFQSGAGTAAFGSGATRLALGNLYNPPGQAVTVDNASQRATADGQLLLAWTGEISQFSLSGNGSLQFLGTSSAERVGLGGSMVIRLRMGAGHDTVATTWCQVALAGSRYVGGRGVDKLIDQAQTEDCTSTDVNLGRDSLLYGTTQGNYTVAIPGFENATVEAPRVHLIGDAADNALRALGCHVTLEGRGSDDRLIAEVAGFPCAHRATVRGGRGDDNLHGTVFDDRLLGGRGRDRADGMQGKDVCRAEVTHRCER